MLGKKKKKKMEGMERTMRDISEKEERLLTLSKGKTTKIRGGRVDSKVSSDLGKKIQDRLIKESFSAEAHEGGRSFT